MFQGIEFKKSDGSPGISDQLNAARTILANERTVLAYIRTSLTLFVAGITFIRFFDNLIVEIIGWVFLPIGIINLVIGVYRYRATQKHINELDLPFPKTKE
ncbi:MAG: hypothetical protein CVT49_16380 [candidate division Zixibacteria bacterium HGW-Zixibacteria-1]|nr:MAG: hypothetical protein CVT49_16380 [candidate division Zixibacteria bacterium HGW-Zixibacteria-1]